MDKPKLTIKINGKERSFHETTTVEHDVNVKKTEEQPKKQDVKVTEFHETSFKQDEPEDVDIPEFVYKHKTADEEIAAANEEREFEWILPEKQEREGFPYDKLVPVEKKRKKPIISTLSIPGKKSNHQKYPFKTLILAIISALVIGTSFGLVVLHLFTEDLAQTAIGVAESGGTEGNGEETGEGASKTPVAAAPITMPALDVFVVQGGVFSSADEGPGIIEDLNSKGFAGSVIQQDGKYLLFIGVGMSDLAAKSMSTPYEAAGQETYVKAFNFPQINAEDDPAIQEAGTLLNQLLVFTSNKYTKMPESESWESIKSTYDKLAGQESDSSFVKAVKEAYPVVEAYQQSSADADLWKSQQVLLTSLQQYQNWILEQTN